jgi:hypothetical protein
MVAHVSPGIDDPPSQAEHGARAIVG